MSEHQTPRVNAPILSNFLNQNIRIVGKVNDLRGDQAIIDAQGSVTLHLGMNDQLTAGNGVEVIGKALPFNNGIVVKVLTLWDLGPDVDFDIAAAVVDVTHTHKSLFYDS